MSFMKGESPAHVTICQSGCVVVMVTSITYYFCTCVFREEDEGMDILDEVGVNLQVRPVA